MISLVPPVIAITVLLSASLMVSKDRAETSVSSELARDLLRHHEHHFAIATEAGFPLGVVDDALPYPLLPLASWRSEVVQDGEQRVLLTWADGYGSDGFDVSVYRALVSEVSLRLGSSGVVGVISFPGEGGARIGEFDLPLPITPVQAGAPAILRGSG